MLVTKADGSQYVETVNDELGLRGKDTEGIRARLKQQGVDAANIDTHGYQDHTSKARRPMSANRGANKKDLSSGSSVASAPQRTAYDRNNAAMKVAAVYRGKLARNRADTERRKNAAILKEQEEDAIEANRPKPRQILRPKGKSYIGF